MIDQSNTDPGQSRKSNNTMLKVILGVVGLCAVLGCGLTALGAAFFISQPSLQPKTQIILEADPDRVAAVKQADLEAAAKILTARCKAVGVSDCSFTAGKNNQIIGRVPASVDVEATVKQIVAIGLLEFVDFGETPIPEGTKVQTDFKYAYFPQAAQTSWHTVMTNQGFQSAVATKDQIGKDAISFELTGEGSKIFADFTSANVGHYLGIVLDKVVLSSPVINSPITAGNGIIQGSFTQAEAEALAAYLRIKGPLPIPLIVKDIVQSGK